MCGLAGFWYPAGTDANAASQVLTAMTDRIRHRGPDSNGHWIDADAGIALGHRRLTILELSPAGAQPMASDSGRYILVFNGEIYNHLALRERLPGSTYRGHSDTETLVRAFDAWGIEEALRQATGMFSLACWDRKDRALFLARDRIGEKPLHYGWQGEGQQRALLFGSELKALTRHPAFEARIDPKAVQEYFERLCVPGGSSIWRGIRKVTPGNVVRFDANNRDGRESAYWSLAEIQDAGRRDQVSDPDAALDLVHDRLAEAVRGQLLSDVPLGAFLSGGVDSSLIVALMQAVSGGTSKTFTIGFEDAGFNESDHARAVASHLGTDHHELLVSSHSAQQVIPRLPQIYDEPFADSSQIPTFLVSEMAREKVTVALSGDGADELFGGYTRYSRALQAWNRAKAVPPLLRRAGASLATIAGPILPDKAARIGALAAADDVVEFYRRFTDHSPFAGRGRSARPGTCMREGTLADQLMASDQLGYLPDDILVKVDRASMAVSLETRAPFLDHRVVAASWQLPADLKRYPGPGGPVGKWPLRQLLDRYVPRSLIERPKQGFAVPVGHWLRGPLRDWADDLLSTDRLAAMGLVDVVQASALWSAHRSGRAERGEQVWALAMLSAWYGEWADPKARAPEIVMAGHERPVGGELRGQKVPNTKPITTNRPAASLSGEP